jgi:asparagine synthase (glutamine-hydrolysing)
MPEKFKISSSGTKLILRAVAEKYIPTKLLQKPKMGFAVPIASWLRGPLKTDMQRILAHSRIAKRNLLSTSFLTSLWDAHLSERRDHSDLLWNIYILELWLERNDF